MTTSEAFLADIIQHPDDDALRLIYADWLEEYGDPVSVARAEFIRLQIKLHDLEADDPQSTLQQVVQNGVAYIRRPFFCNQSTAELYRREVELLELHADEWTPDLGKSVRYPVFRRGFIGEVTIAAGPFLRRGAELIRLVPLRRVEFTTLGSISALARSPLLARLEAIVLPCSGTCDDAHLDVFFSSPHLTALRELHLGRSWGGTCWLRHLLPWPGFDQLTRLFFDGLDEEGVRELARSPRVANLRVLRLHRNQLGDAAAQELARSPYLGSLVSLDLNFNRIGDRGAIALVSTEGLAHMQSLHLTDNRVGDKGARDLARSPGLHRLTRLDLYRNPIGPRAAATLRAASDAVRLGEPTWDEEAG